MYDNNCVIIIVIIIVSLCMIINMKRENTNFNYFMTLIELKLTCIIYS